MWPLLLPSCEQTGPWLPFNENLYDEKRPCRSWKLLIVAVLRIWVQRALWRGVIPWLLWKYCSVLKSSCNFRHHPSFLAYFSFLGFYFFFPLIMVFIVCMHVCDLQAWFSMVVYYYTIIAIISFSMELVDLLLSLDIFLEVSDIISFLLIVQVWKE